MASLASLEEFELRIPGGITAQDQGRAQALLDDASNIIRAEGLAWGEPNEPAVPDAVKTVCISAAKRAFVNPEGVQAESLDNFSTTFTNESSDVYLTKAERRLVKKLAGASGLWTQSTTRAENDIPDVPSVADGDEEHDSGPTSEFFE